MLFGISFSPRQPSARQLYCHVKEYKLLILKIWNPFQIDKPESEVRNPQFNVLSVSEILDWYFRTKAKVILRTRLAPIDCMQVQF